jgi:phosphate transport system protein
MNNSTTDHNHIVRAYDKELVKIDTMIATMGGYCEMVLTDALLSLRQRNPDLAEATILIDDKINLLDLEIEEKAIRMIALRQPMAQDLRQLLGAIRISTDLERIGDLGKNLAKRAITVSEDKHPKPIRKDLKRMGKLVRRQLGDALDAYARRDAEKALEVWEGDEEVDDMYTSIFRELLTYMMEDPRNITLCTHLLFGARNLERIGDHTTHIARNVHFLVTGETIGKKRPKSDDTSGIQVTPEGPEAPTTS